MSLCARLATMLLLAIHVAVAAAPCPIAKLPARGADFAALAGTQAHPCPGHAQENAPASAWFDSFCPCGCESGAAPGNGGSRIAPALLLAELALSCAPERETGISAPPAIAGLAPAPPDHVPLIA